jgi:hypothetical protein
VVSFTLKPRRKVTFRLIRFTVTVSPNWRLGAVSHSRQARPTALPSIQRARQLTTVTRTRDGYCCSGVATALELIPMGSARRPLQKVTTSVSAPRQLGACNALEAPKQQLRCLLQRQQVSPVERGRTNRGSNRAQSDAEMPLLEEEPWFDACVRLQTLPGIIDSEEVEQVGYSWSKAQEARRTYLRVYPSDNLPDHSPILGHLHPERKTKKHVRRSCRTLISQVSFCLKRNV